MGNVIYKIEARWFDPFQGWCTVSKGFYYRRENAKARVEELKRGQGKGGPSYSVSEVKMMDEPLQHDTVFIDKTTDSSSPVQVDITEESRDD